MSNNYSKLILLNIEDENIFISSEPIQIVSFESQSAKLVQLINRSLNKILIQVMNTYLYSNPKLKNIGNYYLRIRKLSSTISISCHAPPDYSSSNQPR